MNKQLKNELINELKAWYDERGKKFYHDDITNITKLTGGSFFIIGKHRTTSEFYFGYSSCGQGPTWEEMQQSEKDAQTKAYFMQANLKEIDQVIETLEDGEDVWIHEGPKCNYHTMGVIYDLDDQPYEWRNEVMSNGFKVNDDDKNAILACILDHRTEVVKKLEGWWKRYGAAKIRTRTYWMDD